MLLFFCSCGFCNTFPLGLNISYSTFFWDWFLFCDFRPVSFFWHPHSVLGFSLRFVVVHPCFITGNNFMEVPWITVVIDLKERFWVCTRSLLGFLHQNMRDPPSWDLDIMGLVIQNVSYSPWWHVKCFSYLFNGDSLILIYHTLHMSDQLFMTLCLSLHFTLSVLYTIIPTRKKKNDWTPWKWSLLMEQMMGLVFANWHI